MRLRQAPVKNLSGHSPECPGSLLCTLEPVDMRVDYRKWHYFISEPRLILNQYSLTSFSQVIYFMATSSICPNCVLNRLTIYLFHQIWYYSVDLLRSRCQKV